MLSFTIKIFFMKTTILLFLFITILSSRYAFAQSPTFDWAKSTEGSFSNDQGREILTDANGDVYIIGHFEGTVDFDPGFGVQNLTSNGNLDIFIQKLDANGNFIWVKQIGGPNLDDPSAATIDLDGNIYLAGKFKGTVDFDPSAGTQNLSSGGAINIFIQKLDLNGNFIWAKRAVANEANDIAVDINGNVYTTGSFSNSGNFDPGGSSAYTFTSNGGEDVYINKLDSNGNTLWASYMGSSDDDKGLGLAVGNNGRLYVTGTFRGTADLNPSFGVYTALNAGSEDVFIIRLSSLGGFDWAKQIGGGSNDIAYAITTDANDNVYTAINFSNTVDFDPGLNTSNLMSNGGSDIAIQKLDANGNFIWAKHMGGPSFDNADAITTDIYGNVYTTGWFKQNVDFDPGTGTTILSSNSTSSTNIYIQKLDSNGDFVWAESFGAGGGASDRGRSIHVDSSLNVYLTGYYEATADFDPGPNTAFLTPTSFGEEEVFILKLNQAMPTALASVSSTNNYLSIYPNPTSGIVSIPLQSLPGEKSIRVYSSNGQLVHTENNIIADNYLLDIEIQPQGLYHIEVSNSKEKYYAKIIKN